MSESFAQVQATTAVSTPPNLPSSATVQPVVRQPRLQVLVNGTPTPAAVSATHSANNWYQSDTFSATFAPSADPNYPPPFWADEQIIQLDIRFSIDGGQSFTSFIVGNVDEAEWDPVTNTITTSGRDLSSLLIEAPTQETFSNQTSSEVAQTLAARHGLKAQVTATTIPVSRYFEIDHDHTTLGRHHSTTTEWDLLTFLAKIEGFDLYLNGQTLVFQAPTAASTPPWSVQIQPSPIVANVINPRFGHRKTLARAVTVEVRSFSSKTGKAVKATATSGGTGKADATGLATRTQTYHYVLPNLSQEMAQKRATSLLTELKKHERTLNFTAPADLTLTPRSLIRVTGTDTPFDQTFYTDTVTREMHYEEAFRMTVAAKNIDQRGQVE